MVMQATFFQTLGDPQRLRIVEALRRGEQPVNHLVDQLDIHQSGVSRHLRILSDAGIVRARPDGPHRLYSLRPAPFRELDAWVDRYRDLWISRLDRFEAALDRKRKETP
jgi:DNA-binding transcriptional ArsR family regulator